MVYTLDSGVRGLTLPTKYSIDDGVQAVALPQVSGLQLPEFITKDNLRYAAVPLIGLAAFASLALPSRLPFNGADDWRSKWSVSTLNSSDDDESTSQTRASSGSPTHKTGDVSGSAASSIISQETPAIAPVAPATEPSAPLAGGMGGGGSAPTTTTVTETPPLIDVIVQPEPSPTPTPTPTPAPSPEPEPSSSTVSAEASVAGQTVEAEVNLSPLEVEVGL